MPGTTPIKGYPYALPADPLVQWPATSQALAEKIDAQMQNGMVTSRVLEPTPVVFPVPFAAPPMIFLAPATAINRFFSVSDITKDGFKAYVTMPDAVTGSTTAVPFYWLAIGT